LYLRLGEPSHSLHYYTQANNLLGGDLEIMLEMTAPLEQLERYREVCQLIEKCIEMAPELQQDKKFMKQLTKLEKKAAKAER
jgi:hypothetical protein